MQKILIFRQGLDDPDELSLGNIAAAGERCIDKVVMVSESKIRKTSLKILLREYGASYICAIVKIGIDSDE